MKTDYTKKIKLDISPIVSSKDMDKFKEDFNNNMKSLKLFDEKSQKRLTDSYANIQKRAMQIKALEEGINNIKEYGNKEDMKYLKEFKKELTKLKGESIFKDFKKNFKQSFKEGLGLLKNEGKTIGEAIGEKIGSKSAEMLKKAGQTVSKFITDTFKAAIEEMNTMASYNYGTSLFQNSESRKYALQYGMSGGQSYAMSKTMEYMGMSSEEDLWYMNENQQKLFAQKIGFYTDKYNSLNNSGFFEKWEQFQTQWKDFKENMMYDIMQWIMDNKETIQKGMHLLITIMKGIISFVGKIADFLGVERTDEMISAKTSDIISNYQTSNKQNNVTVNNSFNMPNGDKASATKVSDIVMSQVIKAIS